MSDSLTIGIAALAVHGVLAVACHLAARGLRRRHRGRFWRRLAWLPFGGLALVALAAARIASGSFGAGDLDPGVEPELAYGFARSLASAINVTSALIVPAWLCYLVTLVALGVGWLRRPQRDERAAPPGTG